ncbi:MAG: 30S ribosome-binding factor RbfA [Beijerinckiaceae bacterium]|nr:30S ribosome-binding factor RbfA [Beijerinckiaceae bacterium]
MSRSHQKGGEPSQRMLRVGELVRHAVSELLTRGHVNDPVLDGHVTTISKVQMSPDLKSATIFVLPLGGGDSVEVLAALEKYRKTFRGEVARKVNLKVAPDVRFRIDDSFDNASAIDALLNSPKVRQDTSGQDTSDQDTEYQDAPPAQQRGSLA